MKKHDEGYVLAYVTVVLLLFCLIATMILTGSMKNLTAQQDTIQRMKDRYAAEGMIQQVIAQISSSNQLKPGEDIWGTEVDCAESEDGNGFVLTAVCDTVKITCTVDASGNYQSFEIGTVATESPEAGEEVSG